MTDSEELGTAGDVAHWCSGDIEYCKLRDLARKWVKCLNEFHEDHQDEGYYCGAYDSPTIEILDKKLDKDRSRWLGCDEYGCTHEGIEMLREWIKYFFELGDDNDD